MSSAPLESALATSATLTAAKPLAPRRAAPWRPGAGWLLPVLTLAGWELGARLGWLPENWFPAPTRIWSTLGALAASGLLLRHVGATLLRVGLGFLLGSALGTLLGVLTGRSRSLQVLLDPSLQALRSIPSLAWVPLFLLWFGIGEGSKIALIAFGVFFPVYLNLTTGLAAIDRRLVEVGELFGYRGWRLARYLLVPAVLPSYVTGLRSGLGLGWMFVVAAELMGASRGLGYVLVDGQTTSRPELVMAAILLFALLGKGTDLTLELLVRIRAGLPA